MKKLKNGSRGSEVRKLQTALNKAGSRIKLKVDGIFGDRTEAAVKTYQKSKRLKVDGIAGSKTLAALNPGKGSSRSSRTKWPYSDVNPIIEQSSKRYLKTREMIDRHLGIARKVKTGDMRQIEKILMASWSQLDKSFRALQKPARALADLELAFAKARKEAPSRCTRMLRQAKALDREAARGYYALTQASDTVENVVKQVAAASKNEIRPVKTATRRVMAADKKLRKKEQEQILQNMKYCAARTHPDFAEFRLRYLKLESDTQKAFNLLLSHQEILINLEDKFNKAIPTTTTSELQKINDRIHRQIREVNKRTSAWHVQRRKKFELDGELGDRIKRKAA